MKVGKDNILPASLLSSTWLPPGSWRRRSMSSSGAGHSGRCAGTRAPTAEIATVAQTQPTKKQWNKRKPDDRKCRRSGDNGQGGQGSAKRKPDPWVSIGICKFHYRYGDGSTSCYQPCLWAGN